MTQLRHLGLRGAAVAAAAAAYVAAYVTLDPLGGRGLFAAGALPIVVTGWLFGMVPGLLAGVAVTASNVLLDHLLLDDRWSDDLVAATPVLVLALATGAAVGRLRDLRQRYETRLEQQRATEVALRASEARWRAVVDSAADHITLVDPNGCVIFINRTGPGFDRNRVLGAHVRDFVPPAARADVEERLRRVIERGERVESESEVVRNDGERAYYRSSYGPIVQDGKVVAAVLVSTDVTAVRQAAEMRDRFLERLVEAQENERLRIARELHDGVGQALTSLLMGLRLLGDLGDPPQRHGQLEELRNLARQTIDDLGRLSRGLHPTVLDDVGLAAALERHVREVQQLHAIDIDLQITDAAARRMAGSTELALYRIAQEALHNVVRHAAAHAVSVVLERERGEISLVVEDNGRGCDLDPDTGLPHKAGLGLIAIRERAAQLGGSLALESSARGTTVYVRIPDVAGGGAALA